MKCLVHHFLLYTIYVYEFDDLYDDNITQIVMEQRVLMKQQVCSSPRASKTPTSSSNALIDSSNMNTVVLRTNSRQHSVTIAIGLVNVFYV